MKELHFQFARVKSHGQKANQQKTTTKFPSFILSFFVVVVNPVEIQFLKQSVENMSMIFRFFSLLRGGVQGFVIFFLLGKEKTSLEKKIAMDSIEIDMLGSFGVQTHKKKTNEENSEKPFPASK